jgi:hypothetical protein
MVTRAKCLMGIIFLLSLATPCWSQTSNPQGPAIPNYPWPYSNPQGPATSYSDQIVYPPYNLFGMPVTNPGLNRQMYQTRPSLPPGVSPGPGGSQPVSEPASKPATEPATGPVPH